MGLVILTILEARRAGPPPARGEATQERNPG
jgi:hypothetical protein